MSFNDTTEGHRLTENKESLLIHCDSNKTTEEDKMSLTRQEVHTVARIQGVTFDKTLLFQGCQGESWLGTCCYHGVQVYKGYTDITVYEGNAYCIKHQRLADTGLFDLYI